jgi:hypothetical protein
MNDDARASGWWQASDGTWHAPGRGPGAEPPAPEEVPGGTAPGATASTGDGPPTGTAAPPPSAPPPRTRGRRPKVVLDSGLWVVLWVLGAVLLVVLIILAVSQVSPAPKKGAGATPTEVAAPVVRTDVPVPTGTAPHPDTPVRTPGHPWMAPGSPP